MLFHHIQSYILVFLSILATSCHDTDIKAKLKQIKYFLFLVIPFFAFSCSSGHYNHNTGEGKGKVRREVCLKEPVSIPSFPTHLTAVFPEHETEEIIGISNFKSDDEYIITCLQGEGMHAEVFSAEDFRKLGSFIPHGHGPGEAQYGYFIGGNALFHKEGHTIAIFEGRGKYLELDVTESIRTNQTVFKDSPIEFNPYLDVYNAHLEGSLYMLRRKDFKAEGTYLNRRFKNGDENFEVESAKQLNGNYLDVSQDTWLLFTCILYNPQLKRVVEAPSMMSVVNIYALDGSFQHSMSVEKRAGSMYKLQQGTRYVHKKYYSSGESFDDYFALLFNNATGEEINNGINRQRIQIFDWDGNPLADIKLDRIIRAYHLDFKRNRILALDMDDHIVTYKIDLSQIGKD